MFDASVEQWRAEVSAAVSDEPIDFVLAWIAMETDGNACGTGKVSGALVNEAGLAQTYYETASRTVDGVTSAELRAACVGTTQRLAHTLTADERALHVRVALATIAQHRAKAETWLSDAGASWSGYDFWAFVKLVHAYPCLAKYLTALDRDELGGLVPAGYDEFTRVVLNMSGAELVALDAAVGCNIAGNSAAFPHLFSVGAVCALGEDEGVFKQFVYAFGGFGFDVGALAQAVGPLDDSLAWVSNGLATLLGAEWGGLVETLLVPAAVVGIALAGRLKVPV